MKPHVKITAEDIGKADRFYEADNCLISTALKRTFPGQDIHVAYDEVFIGDKKFTIPTLEVDLIAAAFDLRNIFPFRSPYYPPELDGMLLTLWATQ
jgi:hypothetical protein